jgi:signal transduction histidine kinase
LSSNYDLSIFQDRDGNIWVGTDRGLDRFSKNPVADLRGLSRSPQAQPPSIQSLVADGQSYLRWTDLKLPAGTKNIQINYTVVNLMAPWRVHFRYKLEGVDTQWQDAGTSRTAYYRNLDPGKYQFHVIANDIGGAWTSNAAVIDFAIPPFWFQTTWFQGLCGAVVLLILWAIYRLRMRQLERQFDLALETRVDERVRIARELHDTLLQSFHGLMFQFQAARNLLPRSPESAMQALDEAILATEQAIAEGRDAIHDLRPDSGPQHELAELLTAAGKELAAVHAENGHCPNFRVIVEGKPQKLSPTLQDEIYRISREVIRNAFHHAVASHIEVEIRYDEHQLRLRIRDNGKGIDPKVLEARGSPGHWGLPGIRERAQQIGSRLEFWSEAGAGTEVELAVPAAMAYEKQRDNHRFRPFRWGGSNDGRS